MSEVEKTEMRKKFFDFIRNHPWYEDRCEYPDERIYEMADYMLERQLNIQRYKNRENLISCSNYERAMKRQEKNILRNMGAWNGR